MPGTEAIGHTAMGCGPGPLLRLVVDHRVEDALVANRSHVDVEHHRLQRIRRSLHIRLLRLDDHLVLILEGDAAKLGQLLMDLAVEWLAP